MEDVNVQIWDKNLILDELKENLVKVQKRKNKYVDKSRREAQFQLDDWTFLKLQPYWPWSRVTFPAYEIVGKVGVLAYKLAPPTYARIYPVFHVSQLRNDLVQE